MRMLALRFGRAAALLALLLFAGAANEEAHGAEQPNILFLFADDQCFDTIRAAGNDEIETPHLDELYARGTHFSHCYNMGGWNGAICIASRTMLNTGRFLWKAHAIDKSAEQERAAGRFWSEYLKRAGYRTYMTGKWHVKAKADRAFDVAAHIRGGMPNQTPEGYNRPLAGQSDPWSPFDPRFGGFWEGGKHWSEVVADDAIGFLDDARQRDQPFFMYIAFNAPHDPRQAPREFVERYDADKLEVPASFLPEYPHNEVMQSGRGLRDERLGPFPRTKHAVQVHRQEYYAIITHMDAQIGRILDSLEESGKADNTWIVFTADHGLAVGHHGLMGKQNMYDHSVRVPFVVIGPGVEAGRTIDEPIYLQDVMPTTLELAGVERPEHVEFQSLLPILSGARGSRYEAIYGAYVTGQRMVKEDGYKLILYPQGGIVRLYHVAEDPEELVDLAEEPASQPIIRRLFSRLLQLQDQTGDTLDLAKAYPALASDAGS